MSVSCIYIYKLDSQVIWIQGYNGRFWSLLLMNAIKIPGAYLRISSCMVFCVAIYLAM